MDFTEQVKATMKEARKAADQMEESSRLVLGATCSRGIQLSDLSLSDSFLDAAVGEGKDITPKSKRSERKATPTGTLRTTIDLDSIPRSVKGNPVPNP